MDGPDAQKHETTLIGLTRQYDKLEFVGRADSQVVTNVVCFRSHPDPLGIVFYAQIGIWRAVRTCHSEPVRTLVWESPSTFGYLIVIQTVLSLRFPEFVHEKWYF